MTHRNKDKLNLIQTAIENAGLKKEALEFLEKEYKGKRHTLLQDLEILSYFCIARAIKY